MPGDRVISDDRIYGVIESISLPGTEDADMHGCPEGGVTVVENYHGVASYAFFSPPDNQGILKDYWLTFIRRGTVIKIAYGRGGPPWPYEAGPFGGGIKGDCEQPPA